MVKISCAHFCLTPESAWCTQLSACGSCGAPALLFVRDAAGQTPEGDTESVLRRTWSVVTGCNTQGGPGPEPCGLNPVDLVSLVQWWNITKYHFGPVQCSISAFTAVKHLNTRPYRGFQ